MSALAQRAVVQELDRRARMTQLDAWLDELDAAHGTPSAKAMADASVWLAAGRPAEPGQTLRRPSRSGGAPRMQGAVG